MNKEVHQRLLSDFQRLGGSGRLAKSLANFSLQNYAKLKYEIGRLSGDHVKPTAGKPAAEKITEQKTETEKPKVLGYANAEKRKVFNDFIADYPLELHPVYRGRWQVWLESCSLKIALNKLPSTAVSEAFAIQCKIYECFKVFDECQKILKHYRVYKRIMPTGVKKDLSGLSELELFKLQNKLRASISRRKKTIEKMEVELPEKDASGYTSKLHSINLKKEQLQEKINELMACEKLLNDGK
ncbi:hypothetical protein [Riemerella columbipharyngis]|uniref:Uncharacterized protein n=1 Tax=Riemerella columbipharyngis TaxID=1071918 RepID=A0A1G7EXN2_9FLAO|nr:hypothetical protein [Riemerella columbipharyngis]SDE68372.1 hypothetical protein SAMN05421544_11812 [Riemerella columbipharyngis]